MRTTIFLVLAVAALGAVGVTTAIMSSGPTPANAALKSGPCPNSSGEICKSGGSGSGIAGGGGGGHAVINPETGDFTGSGGTGHQGGFHETGNLETGFSCVGSICPPTHP